MVDINGWILGKVPSNLCCFSWLRRRSAVFLVFHIAVFSTEGSGAKGLGCRELLSVLALTGIRHFWLRPIFPDIPAVSLAIPPYDLSTSPAEQTFGIFVL
ncbi:hypothetical protein AAFF_G00328110 [Aldrovandia affinis]|uniref:Uncharacterized protein n=1 Tax=Aldrovandia affinis TaxID=143900 RepID=A0AAD7TA14_9TELE|nr:hypothetical protein AAFF_G00328110 [Aldrovandia affinis]